MSETAIKPGTDNTNRHLKTTCATCGYVARVTRKWLGFYGPPHCPLHGKMKLDTVYTEGVS